MVPGELVVDTMDTLDTTLSGDGSSALVVDRPEDETYSWFTPPDEVDQDLVAALDLSGDEAEDALRYGVCGRGTKIQGYMDENDPQILQALSAEEEEATPELQTLTEKVNQALASHYDQASQSRPPGTELAYWLSPHGPKLVWAKPAPGRRFYDLDGGSLETGPSVTYGQALLHVITFGLYKPWQ